MRGNVVSMFLGYSIGRMSFCTNFIVSVILQFVFKQLTAKNIGHYDIARELGCESIGAALHIF